MRNTFVRALQTQMEDDKDTILLTADLGWASFDQLREKYPDRVLNMGLSEQAMVGVSGGMAKMGKNVFVYSIIPFMLYRAFEQVRDDVCYPDLPVRLVGTGAGLSYGDAGSTHHPFEDLRIAAALPNMTVLSPSDPKEVEVLTEQTRNIKHPVYMRLGRNGEPVLHDKHNQIRIGKALKLTEGKEVLIVSTGVVTGTALEAARVLNAEVLEIHTFKPFDEEAVRKEAKGKSVIATVEDCTGALEERVAKALAGAGSEYKPLAFKFPDQFTHISAKSEYLLEHYGISANNIVEQVKKAMA